MSRLLRACAIALILSAATGAVLANEVREMSLEKKARQSDLVVIGRVMSTRKEKAKDVTLEYARVRVDKILKGTPPEPLDVLSKDSIAELNPDCCEIGRAYLFFLVKAKQSTFASVNGRFGILPLDAR